MRNRKPKTSYIAIGETKVGFNWRPTPAGQTPQRFAVYREQTSASHNRGLKVRVHKLLATFSNRTLAEEDALRRTQLVNGPSTRTLGQRFGTIGKVIAGSINSPFAKGERS